MPPRDRVPVFLRSSIVVVAWLALAAIALGACSEEPAKPTVQPTSAFPTNTGPPATGPTPGGTGRGVATGPAPTGVIPTTLPGAGTVDAGEASISVAGDLVATKALRVLVATVYSPPPGGMALVWTAGGTDATTLGLGGLSFTGSQPTATTLSLTLTVQTEESLSSFISMSGECTVAIDVADDEGIAGGFVCEGLVGSAGEVVDATGTFSARG